MSWNREKKEQFDTVKKTEFEMISSVASHHVAQAKPSNSEKNLVASNRRRAKISTSGNKERVTINVSGLIYETHVEVLDRLPNTLLGSKDKRIKYWDDERKEYFFDRHRDACKCENK